MSDVEYQLKQLRSALVQEEEVLSAISDTHNHAEVKEHVKRLKDNIKKLEDWQAQQEPIRAGMIKQDAPGVPVFGNGAI